MVNLISQCNGTMIGRNLRLGILNLKMNRSRSRDTCSCPLGSAGVVGFKKNIKQY